MFRHPCFYAEYETDPFRQNGINELSGKLPCQSYANAIYQCIFNMIPIDKPLIYKAFTDF